MLYSPNWTNTGFSFILLTVNLFRHSTLTEQGLYWLRTSVVIHVYKARARRNGYRMFISVYILRFCMSLKSVLKRHNFIFFQVICILTYTG